MGELAATMVTQLLASGVAWDHAVTPLGMAAKSLTVGMPWEDQVQRIAHAQKASSVEFNHAARIAFVDASGEAIELASPADVKQKSAVQGVKTRIVFY